MSGVSQSSRYPNARLLRFSGNSLRRSVSAGGTCQNREILPLRLLQNQRSHSATSMSHFEHFYKSEDSQFFQLRRNSPANDSFEPIRQFEYDCSANYGVKLLGLNYESEPPPSFKKSETILRVHPLLTPERRRTHDFPTFQSMRVEPTTRAPSPRLKLKKQTSTDFQDAPIAKCDAIPRTLPPQLNLETPTSLGVQNEQLMRIERLYKAKLARMSDELRFLSYKSQFDLSKSPPDISKTDEVSTLKLAIAQMERFEIFLFIPTHWTSPQYLLGVQHEYNELVQQLNTYL